MKKILSSLVALCMIVGLTACGQKGQTVVYRSEQEENGLSMVDTMTLEARGDKVQTITEVIELDMSQFDEEQQTLLVSAYDELVEQYKSVEGVDCTNTAEDGAYTIHITIDATSDAIAQLAEIGLLEVDGNTEGISLQKTGDSLTANGYTLVD
jgi:uncharacterized lipoprotein YehR (DUF1307 family)